MYNTAVSCVVWCGVVWCGAVWCGVVWCGVVCGVSCVVCTIQHCRKLQCNMYHTALYHSLVVLVEQHCNACSVCYYVRNMPQRPHVSRALPSSDSSLEVSDSSRVLAATRPQHFHSHSSGVRLDLSLCMHTCVCVSICG